MKKMEGYKPFKEGDKVGELSPTDVLKLSMLEGNTGTFNTGSFRKR